MRQRMGRTKTGLRGREQERPRRRSAPPRSRVGFSLSNVRKLEAKCTKQWTKAGGRRRTHSTCTPIDWRRGSWMEGAEKMLGDGREGPTGRRYRYGTLVRQWYKAARAATRGRRKYRGTSTNTRASRIIGSPCEIGRRPKWIETSRGTAPLLAAVRRQRYPGWGSSPVPPLLLLHFNYYCRWEKNKSPGLGLASSVPRISTSINTSTTTVSQCQALRPTGSPAKFAPPASTPMSRP